MGRAFPVVAGDASDHADDLRLWTHFFLTLGALAAAASFATLADMFQMGRQAETEALFILLASASLLRWHRGWMRSWPAGLTWSIGYGLITRAMLTKGIQAPAYFVGSVGSYLVLLASGAGFSAKAHLSIAGLRLYFVAWIIP